MVGAFGSEAFKSGGSFVCLKALKANKLRLDEQMNRWQLNERVRPLLQHDQSTLPSN